MSNLLFSLNIVMPMTIMMVIGYLFKKIGLFSSTFIREGKKFCFYVLLSCSLFKNLYDSDLIEIPYNLIILVVVSILIEFFVSLFISKAVAEKKNQIGVMIQGAIRSNFAYVGLPLASLFFSQSDMVAKVSTEMSMMSIFVIPMFNILSVIGLSIYGEHEDNNVLKNTLKAIFKNPCIRSIFLGIMVLLFRIIVPGSAFFIKNQLNPLYKILVYMANMSTPFALLLVGASLEFKSTNKNVKMLTWTVLLKDLLFPGVILLAAYLLKGYTAAEYAVLISIFASPAGVTTAILAQEMKGDGDLANEVVVYTTIFSIFSLLLIISILKGAGCL